MSVLTSLKELLAEAGPSGGETTAGSGSKGAYWCHDCDERIPEFHVEGEDPPTCPTCGESMEFERSPDSAGCAC